MSPVDGDGREIQVGDTVLWHTVSNTVASGSVAVIAERSWYIRPHNLPANLIPISLRSARHYLSFAAMPADVRRYHDRLAELGAQP